MNTPQPHLHRFVLPAWPNGLSAAQAQAHYERVERVIHRLLEAGQNAPPLDDLAADAGLSPGHFQRVFTQWAGVSPKRFVQFLGQRHAAELLRQGATVLDAALGAGLSGPGRLHDSLLTWQAMTPGEVRAGGAGLTLQWGRAASLLGPAWLAWGPRGLCHLAFEPWDDTVSAEAIPAALAVDWPHATWQRDDSAAADWLARVFGPTRAAPPDQPLALWLRGSPFQIKVWEALLRIPPGQLMSYGALAQRIGQPQAQRAVGSALAANRLACLIPCHRVIQGSARIGQYRWGAARKAALIGLEAAGAELVGADAN
ncbi:methylated-DNA--[protein]-cysteine S-methyltransferase [Amphibiibacter pelophylacis]|uniref:Methylated-DNA--[protein]-cysteine S-methyltransferase n=1 Tax=Amphibiibacter pelophylacis TaxID=1799477 RepID=A0ACC6P1P2_9BURK